MLNGFFSEPTPGQVAHSAMSLLLASSEPIKDYVGHAIGFSYPVSTKMVEMTERFRGSEAKNETAFNVAFGTPLPMFAWLKGEPEHSERFGRLMGAMKAAPVYSVQHLVNGYNWGSLSSGKVVDVGGSFGHASLAVLEKYPDLTFVVQDLPEVVGQGEAKLPDFSTKKLEFMAHDFFEEQPVKDADVYLLRQILHDWPDAEAITILKNLVMSMKPRAKIIIMDQVVPPPGLLPNSQEKAARTIDLVVMSHFNGKQRDMDDWKKVFAAVDHKLVLSDLLVQPGSVLSIIELSLLDEPVANGHSAALDDPVANGHSTALDDPVANGHSTALDEPVANGHSTALDDPVANGHSTALDDPVANGHYVALAKPQTNGLDLEQHTLTAEKSPVPVDAAANGIHGERTEGIVESAVLSDLGGTDVLEEACTPAQPAEATIAKAIEVEQKPAAGAA
jgi:hypothetical protein